MVTLIIIMPKQSTFTELSKTINNIEEKDNKHTSLQYMLRSNLYNSRLRGDNWMLLAHRP